jgi:creatinine amidohydrolase/Fe(II)-dependent formamide hydrolase-like protein
VVDRSPIDPRPLYELSARIPLHPGVVWSLLKPGAGVWGEPSTSTAAKGEEFLEWCTRAVVDLVRDMDDVHDGIGVRK